MAVASASRAFLLANSPDLLTENKGANDVYIEVQHLTENEVVTITKDF
jgi:ATP-dependent protease HslVU (ClpYQ) ATPase subunit